MMPRSAIPRQPGRVPAPAPAARQAMTLAVMSAPRIGVSYVERTLALLDGPAAGGWRAARKVVLCDGYRPDVPAGWDVIETPGYGSARALWYLLAAVADAPLVFYVEDDVTLCRNALPYIERYGVPDGLAAVSYFQGQGERQARPRLDRHAFAPVTATNQPARFQGGIALALPSSTIAKLLATDISPWPHRHHKDAAIGAALDGLSYGAHVPNLVQHVGAVSAIRMLPPRSLADPARVSASYVGDDFDAMSWLPVIRADQAIWGGRQPVEPDIDAKLTICIPSYADRTEMLFRLVTALQAQDRADEVEILIATDGGHTVVGAKRNRLVASAAGRYIVHIDDDDEVAADYIPKILAAIDANPGVDAITLRGRRTHETGTPVLFDYVVGGIDGTYEDGVLWRTPNHLCPIRADLAKSMPFPRKTRGEDLDWGKSMRPLLRTEARAGQPGEVLYFYRWEPNKPHRRPQGAGRRHREIFTPQYTERSGPGSTADASAPYRAFLERFIGENKIRSIVDLACGDFEIMSLTDRKGATYLGVDVIAERIARDRVKASERPQEPEAEFECADIQAFPIPPTDLLIVKDVLQHWCTADVMDFLLRLQDAPFRYALLTNCNYGPTVNTDVHTGGWRALDLTAAPFSIGEIVFHWETAVDTKDVVLLYGRGC